MWTPERAEEMEVFVHRQYNRGSRDETEGVGMGSRMPLLNQENLESFIRKTPSVTRRAWKRLEDIKLRGTRVGNFKALPSTSKRFYILLIVPSTWNRERYRSAWKRSESRECRSAWKRFENGVIPTRFFLPLYPSTSLPSTPVGRNQQYIMHYYHYNTV
jgi:hypothetical protein